MRVQQRGLIAVVVALACGDDVPPASSQSPTSSGPAATSRPATVTTAMGSTAPADESSDDAVTSTGGGTSSGTGVDACAQPVDVGRAVDWTGYGRDASNSRHNPDEVAITVDNVHCLTRRWSRTDLISVTSTPAVVGEIVYFGEWDGRVHAANVADGVDVWATNVGAQVNDSPLVTDDAVYVGDADGFAHRLGRADGAVQWSVELDAHPATGIYSSPVLAGDVLVIGVASVELATPQDDYTFRGAVVGLDPASGVELWRVYTAANTDTSGAGVSVWSSAAYDDERGWIYVGSGNAYEEPAGPLSDSLLAIDAATGDIQWTVQFTQDDVFTIFGPAASGPDADVGAAPNLFTTRTGRDLVGVGDKAGYYRALDRDTGAIVWVNEVGPGAPLGGIMTTAAVADGVIYVANNTWNALYDFGNDLNTGTTVAISVDDGVKLWEAPQRAAIFGALTVAGGVVYHGTVRGDVLALDASDGSELWHAEPGYNIGGGFSVANGLLFVGHGFWFITEPNDPKGGLVAYGLP